jgi:PhnB protein
MHALLRIGDSMLMLADDFSVEFHQPPLATGRLPFVINHYVPDADAAWAKALAAGCEVVFPIADQFWGDRYGHVKDPCGMVWAITSRKEELTPEEMRERGAKLMGSHG